MSSAGMPVCCLPEAAAGKAGSGLAYYLIVPPSVSTLIGGSATVPSPHNISAHVTQFSEH
jgi:hypothetical protein